MRTIGVLVLKNFLPLLIFLDLEGRMQCRTTIGRNSQIETAKKELV